MSRLIDADALIEDIEKNCFYFMGNTYKENETELIERIENFPTIEAVPVVHGQRKGCE